MQVLLPASVIYSRSTSSLTLSFTNHTPQLLASYLEIELSSVLSSLAMDISEAQLS